MWHNGIRVCDAEVAETREDRRRGLIGREDLTGVLVLRPCRSVHSFRMRFVLDVAGCRREADGSFRVRWVRLLLRNRALPPGLVANVMIEAKFGSFKAWGIKRGDRIEIK